MALKKCKECGHEVSTKADKCPNCGASVKKKGMGCSSWLVILIILVVVVPYIIGKQATEKQKSKQKEVLESAEHPMMLIDTDPDKFVCAIFNDKKGRNFAVGRLRILQPETYADLQDILGTDYSFLNLLIDNENGKETMNWHCWSHKITIHLKDGVKLESLDLITHLDFDLYSKLPEWQRKDFTCTKSVFPGKTAVLFLAFPSFSWTKVEKIHFSTGLTSDGFGYFVRLEEDKK